MSAALGLFRLQQVDSQIDQIHARLKTIEETLHNDLELRAAAGQLEAAETKYKSAEREVKQSDADVEKQRIKIEQAEASLYGGQVHNPKELQDYQKDVASLKRHLETLESRELDSMMVMESAENEFLSAKTLLEQLKLKTSGQHRELVTESKALQKEIERLDSERNAATKNLPEESVQVYNRLRQQRRGVAVATISDSACAACGTTLTPAQQQSARSTSQLFNCPTCGRILYAN